jgi:hypothetical protein
MIHFKNILKEVISYEFDQFINGENLFEEICCVLESPARIGGTRDAFGMVDMGPER